MSGERMKRHWFHILLALSHGDLHGSGIVRAVLDQTDGELRLWPATLYGSLHDLAEEGWIEELTDGEHPEGESERRRYYRLTTRGRTELRTEADRMAQLARLAQSATAG